MAVHLLKRIELQTSQGQLGQIFIYSCHIAWYYQGKNKQ